MASFPRNSIFIAKIARLTRPRDPRLRDANGENVTVKNLNITVHHIIYNSYLEVKVVGR